MVRASAQLTSFAISVQAWESDILSHGDRIGWRLLTYLTLVYMVKEIQVTRILTGGGCIQSIKPIHELVPWISRLCIQLPRIESPHSEAFFATNLHSKHTVVQSGSTPYRIAWSTVLGARGSRTSAIEVLADFRLRNISRRNLAVSSLYRINSTCQARHVSRIQDLQTERPMQQERRHDWSYTDCASTTTRVKLSTRHAPSTVYSRLEVERLSWLGNPFENWP